MGEDLFQESLFIHLESTGSLKMKFLEEKVSLVKTLF